MACSPPSSFLVEELVAYKDVSIKSVIGFVPHLNYDLTDPPSLNL